MRRARRGEGAGALVVVCLSVYPAKSAATRLRLTQHFPFVEDDRTTCRLWSFLVEDDLPHWYGSSFVGRVRVLLRGLARVPEAVRLIRQAGVVVVQRECLPVGPPWLERWAARGRPLVWDVDDFVWRSYTSGTAGRWTRWIRTSERKHDRTCRAAAEVWAGSGEILAWTSSRNPRSVYVPTVVEVPVTRPLGDRALVAAWVGTHSGVPALQEVVTHLEALSGLEGIVVMGAEPARVDAADLVRHEAWSLSGEVRVCSSARVGLYPVDRTNPYAEGKCGLKAILYMAHGLPCVITPTGPNRAIVRDGIDGFHADAPEEWRRGVRQLLEDDELWERCSRAAHARALEHYSLQAWGPVVAARLRALVASYPAGTP